MVYLNYLFVCVRLINLLKCKFFTSSLFILFFISIELELNAILDLYIELTIHTFLLIIDYLIHIGAHELLTVKKIPIYGYSILSFCFLYIPLLKIQYPLLKIQYPLLKIQYPLLKIQYPLLKIQYPLLKIQYPLYY